MPNKKTDRWLISHLSANQILSLLDSYLSIVNNDHQQNQQLV